MDQLGTFLAVAPGVTIFVLILIAIANYAVLYVVIARASAAGTLEGLRKHRAEMMRGQQQYDTWRRDYDRRNSGEQAPEQHDAP